MILIAMLLHQTGHLSLCQMCEIWERYDTSSAEPAAVCAAIAAEQMTSETQHQIHPICARFNSIINQLSIYSFQKMWLSNFASLEMFAIVAEFGKCSFSNNK